MDQRTLVVSCVEYYSDLKNIPSNKVFISFQQSGFIDLILDSFRPVNAEIDETKLTLALSNLVENAIKYNVDAGWVRVSLNADHKYFYVTVADSGVGIPEDNLDHIFERFYREDKARNVEGNGLGLAIVKSIVDLHHGKIDILSQVDVGTNFIVRLPIEKQKLIERLKR